MRYHKLLCDIYKIVGIVLDPEIPPDLIFFPTSRCIANCYYCLFHEQVHDRTRKDSELKLDEIEKIARNYRNLTKISLSGGEPFIREDIAEIVRIFDIYTKPRIIDIPTNGFYVDSIAEQVEKMLYYTSDNKPILEIQLSIDGPSQIHDKVRGVNGIFNKVLQTYGLLDGIRKTNHRLKIKMNLTYVIENEDLVINLADEFDKKYNFDRFQITFPHGVKANENVIPYISYHKYIEQSSEILRCFHLSNPRDLHSLIFRAVKMIKDDILLSIMRKGDMGSRCRAGRRILAIDDQGKVYPCEPIWCCIGDLRETNYEILPILRGKEYRDFSDKYLGKSKCNCAWGNVILDSIVFNPKYFPKILFNMLKLYISKPRGIVSSKSRLVQNHLKKSGSIPSCPIVERKGLLSDV